LGLQQLSIFTSSRLQARQCHFYLTVNIVSINLRNLRNYLSGNPTYAHFCVQQHSEFQLSTDGSSPLSYASIAVHADDGNKPI